MPLIKTITSGNCSSLVFNDAGFPCTSKHLVRDVWLRMVYADWTGDVEFWRSGPVLVHTATHYVVPSEYRYVSFRHQYYGRHPWWRDLHGDNLSYPWFFDSEGFAAKPRCACIPLTNGENVDLDDEYGGWPIYFVRVILDAAVWVDPITKIQDNDFRTMGAKVYLRIYNKNVHATWEGTFQRGKYTTYEWTNNIAPIIPEDCGITIGDYEYISNYSTSSNSGYFFNSYRVVNDPGTLTVHSVDPV